MCYKKYKPIIGRKGVIVLSVIGLCIKYIVMECMK
jgi:hypothetical protein